MNFASLGLFLKIYETYMMAAVQHAAANYALHHDLSIGDVLKNMPIRVLDRRVAGNLTTWDIEVDGIGYLVWERYLPVYEWIWQLDMPIDIIHAA